MPERALIVLATTSSTALFVTIIVSGVVLACNLGKISTSTAIVLVASTPLVYTLGVAVDLLLSGAF